MGLRLDLFAEEDPLDKARPQFVKEKESKWDLKPCESRLETGDKRNHSCVSTEQRTVGDNLKIFQ